MFVRSLLAVVAVLASTASAQLTITNPTSDIWWVANSINTLAWTCNTSPYATFNVFINNNNTDLLTDMLAIFSEEPNYDCSQTVTPEVPVGTGYWLTFTDPLNSNSVYAASSSFEIKAQGSTYAQTSSTSSPSATSTGATSTATKASSAASSFSVREGVVGAIAAVVGFLAL